jgi:hypothetical protein
MWLISLIGLKRQPIFLPENIYLGKSLMVFKKQLPLKMQKMHFSSEKL